MTALSSTKGSGLLTWERQAGTALVWRWSKVKRKWFSLKNKVEKNSLLKGNERGKGGKGRGDELKLSAHQNHLGSCEKHRFQSPGQVSKMLFLVARLSSLQFKDIDSTSLEDPGAGCAKAKGWQELTVLKETPNQRDQPTPGRTPKSHSLRSSWSGAPLAVTLHCTSFHSHLCPQRRVSGL